MLYVYPARLLLLFLIIIPIFLIILNFIFRKKTIQFFNIPKKALLKYDFFKISSFTFFIVTLILIIITFAGPHKNKKETKKSKVKGNEILFMVDVSRSMLAEDVYPSRLEKIKIDLEEFIWENKGNKMGLIAFAGDAVIKCPMTTDSFFLLQAVKELQAGSVGRGSTSLASALRKSVTMMPIEETGSPSRDIIIFTDGEDHEEDPVSAAIDTEKRGGRLLIFAIGNKITGGRIPIIDENGKKSFLTHEGREVWSKTDLKILKSITAQCKNSALVPVLDGSYDLQQHYNSFIKRVGKSSSVSDEIEIEVEAEYIIIPFALIALLFLIIGIYLKIISQRIIKYE